MPDLDDGESVEVKGSGARPYVLKNSGGLYSCSCPAWRNQSTAIERRTCKHLRKLRGDEAEVARVGGPEVAEAATAAEEGSGKVGPPLLLAERWDNAQDLIPCLLLKLSSQSVNFSDSIGCVKISRPQGEIADEMS